MEYSRNSITSDLYDITPPHPIIKLYNTFEFDNNSDTINVNDDYAEYKYNGLFNLNNIIWSGYIKLICCCKRNGKDKYS